MAAESSRPVLQMKGVCKSYLEGDGRRLPVLEIEHFQVQPGEQLAVMGRSGCGKTTLLHIIAGIASADRGQVLVDGIEITKLSEAARDRVRAAKIGYVFQTFNLMPGFTALENVLLGMTFSRQRKDEKRARELLARVGLEHRLRHKPNQLSVGEQQRVAVARALANQPRLMLADEPTANVDPANQQHIVDLIRSTCEHENVSLIMVTHAREVASQFERLEKLESINRVLERTPVGSAEST